MVLYIWILNILQSSTAQNCLAYSFSPAMALLALLSLSLVLFSFSPKNITLTQAQCLPDQRQALIQLKQGFKTTELNSWNVSIDCCIWDGITCDEQTSMVTALNLFNMSISGELSPALFNLSSLQYFNLSENYFYNITLPQTGFERLGNLTHLDLYNSGFAGQVPIGISTLTKLIELCLSSSSKTNQLYLRDTGLATLLSNLTKLKVLCLDAVDISLDGSEWGNAIFQVGPTLQQLFMQDCGLTGNFPNEIFHLTNLTKLYLTANSLLSGQLPEFTKQSFLQSLSLGYINFTGPLPDSIGNLQYLSELALFSCNFYGEIPPSITNLTRLRLLYLGGNQLTGTIPMSLFSHPSLEDLGLSDNQLSGYVPEFSNGSSVLKSLGLGDNNLEGPFPTSIFKFPQLVDLSIESNNFNGTFNLDIIKHNKKLHYLDLSNNKLSIIEGKNNNESFYASFPQLETLILASSNLTKFPAFLSYQTNIYYLDLSNNSLRGEIPLSICSVTLPTVLVLSYNNLTGIIPPCLLEGAGLKVLNLKSNKLIGPLPRNITKACELHTINMNGNVINGSLPKLLRYCNALQVLDIGNNQIVNKFPYWLGNLENLNVLVLRSNMFYGKISDMKIKTIGNDSFFPMLKVLDLSSNQFSGTLPKNIFLNLKAMMIASNTSFLSYFDMNVTLVPYDVATVTYKGMSFDLMNFIGIFSYIDLSNNEFWGRIPEEIGKLESLDVLNLSHNTLIGPISKKIANLKQLQLLDLSSNQLSGHIPQELTSLTFLSALNLSYNNLIGEIPQVPQLSTFSNASYMGNPGLCGSPLSMHCPTTASNHGFNKGFPSKSSIDVIGISVSIGLGIGVGFAFVIWATILWKNGIKWFNFIIDRIYFQHFH
ncbi:uncharacterized protein LOC144545338 [Carex rostrata]